MGDFFSAHEYFVSFVLGVAAIAHFAFKQLNEPFAEDTNYLPADLQTSPSIVTSRSLFVEAYIYYALILLVFYFVLCFSEPVYTLVFGADSVGANSSTGFNPESGTWPLTVALLIVGLSPNFPVLKDAELLFRKFSRRSAGIPRNFVETLRRVQRLRLVSTENDESYAHDIEEVVEILSVYWAISGKPRPAFEKMSRNVRRALRLYNWTISPDSSIGWSSQARAKISDFDNQGAVGELHQARNDVLAILIHPQTDKFHDAIRQIFGKNFTYDDREHADLLAEWQSRKEEVSPILEKASLGASILARHISNLETTFSLLVTHDNSTRNIDDTVLKRNLEHLHSFQSSYTRNLILSSAALAALFSFLIACFVFYARSHLCLGEKFGPALVHAIGLSWSYGVSFLVSISGGVLGALFYYKVKDVEERGGPLNDSIIPLGYYFGLLILAFLFTSLGTLGLWIFINFPAASGINIFYLDLKNNLGQILIDALPGAVFGSVFVILLEMCSSSAARPLHKTSVNRLALYVLLAGTCAVASTFVSNIVYFSQLESDIWSLCARNSKLAQIVLSGAVPVIVLIILIPQMRTIARLRGEPETCL